MLSSYDSSDGEEPKVVSEEEWLTKKLFKAAKGGHFASVVDYVSRGGKVIRDGSSVLSAMCKYFERISCKHDYHVLKQIFEYLLDCDCVDHQFANKNMHEDLLFKCYQTFGSRKLILKIIEKGVLFCGGYYTHHFWSMYDLWAIVTHNNISISGKFAIWDCIDRCCIISRNYLKTLMQFFEKKVRYRMSIYIRNDNDVKYNTLDYVFLRSGQKPSVEHMFIIDLFVEFR